MHEIRVPCLYIYLIIYKDGYLYVYLYILMMQILIKREELRSLTSWLLNSSRFYREEFVFKILFFFKINLFPRFSFC